jgi:hypothetical protein
MLATSVILEKLTKVNNHHQIGENLANLVTLLATYLDANNRFLFHSFPFPDRS